jgi:hypothetical protein
MRFFKIALSVFASLHITNAYKGMNGVTKELLSTLTAESNGVVEMIGDLQTGAITATGKDIRDCLTGDADCQSTVSRVSQYHCQVK